MPDVKTTILVVDDDETNRDLLALILKSDEFRILTAEDGRKALNILKSQPVDLVLLDLMMPVIDGYQVLRVMNADLRLKDIPVVVITAVGKIESVRHCVKLGAKDYLLKPYNQDVVRNRITAILAMQRLQTTKRALTQQIEQQKKLTRDISDFAITMSLKLSEERDFDNLADHIVHDAMSYCHAEAGILYIRTENDTLRFEVVRNETLDISLGGSSGQPCPYQPVLIMSDSSKNEPNIRFAVTRAYHSRKQINLNLDNNSVDGDLFTTRFFNEEEKFRAISFLITPLISPSGFVNGVLELINPLDGENGLVTSFHHGHETIINTFCQITAVILDKYRLQQQINSLTEAFLKQDNP